MFKGEECLLLKVAYSESFMCYLKRFKEKRFTSLIARRQAGNQPTSLWAWLSDCEDDNQPEMKKYKNRKMHVGGQTVLGLSCTQHSPRGAGVLAPCSSYINTEAYRPLRCWSLRGCSFKSWAVTREQPPHISPSKKGKGWRPRGV